MSKDLLSAEEKNNLGRIRERIEKAMERKGYKTVSDLSQAIKKKRKDCPDKSIYSRFQYPPHLDKNHYSIRIDNLLVIADGLGVSTDYLLGLTETMERADSIRNYSLGLSDSSLQKLAEIRRKSKEYPSEKVKSESRYYLNPYMKILRILNFVIEHINVDMENEGNYENDFLTVLYYLVMLRFDNKSAMTEAVVDSLINATFEEYDKYEKLLEEYQHVHMEEDDKESIIKKLEEARQAYVRNISINERNRSVLKDVLNGIVTVADPVTYEQTRIRLSDPYESFTNKLLEIIHNWRDEYNVIYEKEKEQQNKTYKKWASNVSKEIIANGGLEDEDMENEELDVPTYLSPKMRKMPVSEQKMYFLYLYIEKTELKNMTIGSNGAVNFSNTDHPDFMKLIKKAEKDKTGLYVTKTGEIKYSEMKAMMPTERAKLLFERYNLPTILKKWIKSQDYEGKYNGYFDELANYEYHSPTEAEEIIAEAEKTGLSYSVVGDMLTVRKKRKAYH